MRYVLARIEKSNRDEAYRIYISKSLQLVPQSKWIDIEYSDLFELKKPEKTGEEIALDVMLNAGLKFEGGD